MANLSLKKYSFISLSITLAGLAVYSVGLHGSYYADDFKLVFSNPSGKIFYFFSHANPNSSFYRPIEWMFAAAVQSLVGMNTFPIHAVILSCHIVLSFLVFSAALKLTNSQLAAWLSSLFMLLSQANAMAVLGNDMLSQVGGTLLGFVSLWLIYRHFVPGGKSSKSFGSYFLSLISFSVSLWFKETSISFVVALTFMVFILLEGNPGEKFLKVLRYLSPFYAISLIYLVVHFSVVTRQTADRYQFGFGVNILKNCGLSIFSAFLPISSVVTFVTYSQHHFIQLAMIVFSTAVVICAVLIGLSRNGLSPLIKILVAVSLANLFPMVLFKHMGELYVYNSMPAFSILFGLGVKNLYDAYFKNQPPKIIGLGLIVLLLLSSAYADYTKGVLGVSNGDRAAELIKEIRPFIDKVPHGGTLVLLNPQSQAPQYSIFLMNGFNVLIYGTNILNQISNRNDIQIWITDEGNPKNIMLPSHAFILTLESNRVKMVEH